MKHTICTLFVIAVGAQSCVLMGRKPEPEMVTNATYQPFTGSYRGVGAGRTTQFFDDQPTITEFGVEFFVTADVAQGGSNLTANLVLDSVRLFDGATGGISSAQADSARGATYYAILTEEGHLADYAGGERFGILARELSDRFLKQFFPTIPGGGAAPGEIWADTVETQIVANGIENTVNMISQHSATEWTIHSGMRALHILTVSEYSFSGAGSQSGRAFTIEGQGRRHTHRYLGEAGRYLGMASADTSDGEARITDMDIAIPIHQTRVDSVAMR